MDISTQRKKDLVHRFKQYQSMNIAQLSLVQLSIMFLNALFFLFFSKTILISAIAGNLCAGLPYLFFIRRTFFHSAIETPKKVMRAFYHGEIEKIVLTVALFTISFIIIKPLAPILLFCNFIIVQWISWFASVIYIKRCHQRNYK